MQQISRYRLRILTAEAHRIEGKPAYEFIVHAAHANGLAGATVLRGIAGFGHSHRVHTSKILDISDDLPVVIEIIDEQDRLRTFAEWLLNHYDKGIFTVEEVQCWL